MKRIWFGLITRIALLVVVIEVAAFGMLGRFYVERFSQFIERQTQVRLSRIGRMIADDTLSISAIAQPSVMHDLIGAPYLDGMVIGGNGRVIVASDPARLGRLARELPGFDPAWLAQDDQADHFVVGEEHLTVAMHTRGEAGSAPIYTTVITVSTADLAAMQRNVAFAGQFGALFFILVTSVGIVLLAQRLIVRRIDASLEILKGVESGDLAARIPVRSEDELGQLQLGINAMIARLAELLEAQQKSASAVRAQKDFLASVIENVPVRVFWKDRELRFLGCNSLFARDAGFARPEELIGKTDFDMAWQAEAETYRADDLAVLRSGVPKLAYEEPQSTPDGRTIWLSTSKVPLRGPGGEIVGVLGIYTDITARKEAEARIYRLAYYDTLTGLPNRALLLERLRALLAENPGDYGALLFIDLDDFKTLNDTVGHAMGDLLLQQVGQRLQACVAARAGGHAEDLVARVGGDEFLVLLTGLGGDRLAAQRAVEALGAEILAALNRSYPLRDLAFVSTPSVGATLFIDHEATVDELLQQADLAMYKAKEAGRNTLCFFNEAMARAVLRRATLEKELRTGIARDEFVLFYQLQVAGAGRPIGAEALVRWQHPEQGLVSPGEFIPLAEDTGLILALGRWVLERACQQLAEWAGDPRLGQLSVAVNVSAQQFRQADFVAQVGEILERTGANPARLKLELTESMLVANVEDVIAKMQALKARGIGFSLDDFGTGYSSLAYLRRLPLDQLKIDQSFVRDVLDDPNDAALARTIVTLAQSLGLGVIAEGVETAAQLDFLAMAGCHAYQGYYFSKPVPATDFECLVRGGSPAAR
jgi:diguanylate cyclase (GGDEF)-like protein/PAS domain S-box-containing protein